MKRAQSSFIDKLRIYCKGGRGGFGNPKVRGKGGDGGSVYLEVSEKQSLNELHSKFPEHRFLAGGGGDASSRALLGQKGSDVVIKVPPGVSVLLDSGESLGDLNVKEEKLLVARGGEGGSQKNGFSGQLGQARSVILDLKLLADVGFVGFPNAGKSSLLRTLSRAKPKIGNYPFTTLKPTIGIMGYEDGRSVSLADLPGLVEGSHVNVGLGHHFLKHVERTQCLLFVVDVMGFQFNPRSPHRTALQTVLLLCRELELYKQAILNKPAICAINKVDIPEGAEMAEEVKYKLENLEQTLRQADSEVTDIDPLPERPFHFEEVFLVSAKQSTGITELKSGLRRWLDEFSRRGNTDQNDENNNTQTQLQLNDSHPAFKENMPLLV